MKQFLRIISVRPMGNASEVKERIDKLFKNQSDEWNNLCKYDSVPHTFPSLPEREKKWETPVAVKKMSGSEAQRKAAKMISDLTKAGKLY